MDDTDTGPSMRAPAEPENSERAADAGSVGTQLADAKRADKRDVKKDKLRWKNHLGPFFGTLKPGEVDKAKIRRREPDSPRLEAARPHPLLVGAALRRRRIALQADFPSAGRKGWAGTLVHASAHSSPPLGEGTSHLRTFDLDLVPGHAAYVRVAVGAERRVD